MQTQQQQQRQQRRMAVTCLATADIHRLPGCHIESISNRCCRQAILFQEAGNSQHECDSTTLSEKRAKFIGGSKSAIV